MDNTHKRILRSSQNSMDLQSAVSIVREILLTRDGDVIDDTLALERARNIVTALSGFRIGTLDEI